MQEETKSRTVTVSGSLRDLESYLDYLERERCKVIEIRSPASTGDDFMVTFEQIRVGRQRRSRADRNCFTDERAHTPSKRTCTC